MTFDEASRTAEQIRAVYGHLGVSATVNPMFVPLDLGYCIDPCRRGRGPFTHLHHVKRLWFYPADIIGGLDAIMRLWFAQIETAYDGGPIEEEVPPPF